MRDYVITGCWQATDGRGSQAASQEASGLGSLFVGRAEELATLARALSRPPAVVLVEGEAGIGKTRLLAELPARPELAGARFLVGGCPAIREPFPLGPVLEAVRGLRDRPPRSRLSPVTGALRPLLPELAGLLAPAPEPLPDRSAERHRVFRALVELFQAVHPVTVVLEDLHWADGQTLDFLRYLLGSPPPTLSLVVTFRGEEVDPAVRSLTGRLAESMTRAQVVLRPFDVALTGELAAGIVNADRVSEDFASYLCERTGGLPFAVEEVMALLRERGVVARQGQQWVRRAMDELAVPAVVRDHVLGRASLLPARTRQVLDAAAVLQRPAPEQLLAALSGQPAPVAAAGLSRAIESGLLVEHGATIGFRHVLAAQAIYDGIPGPRRRALHDRAAAALKGQEPMPLGQIAHHLRQAGRLDDWAVVAEAAADQAVELGHDGEAARLLEEALRQVSPGAGSAGRIAVKLGRAAIELLRIPDVHDLLSKVLEHEQPRAVRGELRFLLGLLYDQTSGDSLRPRQLFQAAVDDLDDRPDLQAWAMVGLGIRGAPPAAPGPGGGWLDRALEILPRVDDPVFEVFLLGKVTSVLAASGDRRWRELAARIEQRAGGAVRQRRLVNAFHSVGQTVCYAGHHRTAERLLAVARTGALACEDERQETLVRSAQAVLDYCRGSWEGLAAATAGLVDQLADQPRSRSMVEVVAGCLALAYGDQDGAACRLGATVAQVDGQDGTDVLPMAVGALVRLAVARGDTAAAAATVDRYVAGLEGPELWPATCRALPWVVEALLAAGRRPDARRLWSRCSDGLSGLDAPLAPAALRHAQGFLAQADGEPSAAAHHFGAAARRYRSLRCPYEAAQAHEQAACALAAAGERERERVAEPLRAALATFQRLGAAWDLGRAARTARRYGVPAPTRYRRGRRGYGPELSPREREVAERAARGSTNKEIADELFISTNTVKKQLASAMRKLDVGSRAAVAYRLAAGHQDDSHTN
ncbi:MAG: AAA family ATPase [Micromonosporaceae bacterium]|nr:AAA family ATPase [Micromonosporaceae bacterium]